MEKSNHQKKITIAKAAKNDEIDFVRLFNILWFNKKKIILAMLLGCLLGAIYSFSIAKVYRSNALIQVDSSNSNTIFNNIDSLLDANRSLVEEQVDLVRSRNVLGRAVEELKLDTELKPVYIPVIGPIWNRLFRNEENTIQIAQFQVPEELINQTFQLKLLTDNRYAIAFPNGSSFEGELGQPLVNDQQVELIIEAQDKEKVRSGEAIQQFNLIKYSSQAVIDNIRRNLSVTAIGRNTNNMALTYSGTDRKQVNEILTSIVNNYVGLNIEKNAQVASGGLSFIEHELPRLREQLSQAENRLNAYRADSQTLDIGLESSGIMRSLTDIEMQLIELNAQKASLAQIFTKEHPEYKIVDDKLKSLEKMKDHINSRISELPASQQDVIRLTRDVEINQTVYLQLLSRQQELSIMKASSLGNVWLVDKPQVENNPISPNKPFIILAMTLAAGFIVAGYFLLKGLLQNGIISANEIELLGANVLVSSPLSEQQVKRNRLFKKIKDKDAKKYLLAQEEPTDIAIESLRALRTQLMLAIGADDKKVVLFTGTMPGVGKSFISANFSAIMAAANKKVLLIDADVRKGYLHQVLGIDEVKGLTDFLNSDMAKDNLIQSTNIVGLDFVAKGKGNNMATELFMNKKFPEFIEWARTYYDFIIIDSPPVLAVTDAIVISQYTDMNILIARYNQTTSNEIYRAINIFQRHNKEFEGVIFNGVARLESDYYGYTAYAS